MGRRNGTVDTMTIGRSSKGPGRKSKHSKEVLHRDTDHGLDDRRKVKRPHDANGSSNGHTREGGTSHTSTSHSNNNNSNNNSTSARNPRRNRSKPLDPTLLARGMTSRSIGARISSQITPLSPSELERDLRHMEAYSAACITYAQQFFAYHNHELVARGLYGSSVTLAPGLASSLETGGPIPTPTLPIRIDPEEEQRLAILRKRVQASEAMREVLETEYMSLRSHFVHESQRLKRTRKWVTGQVEFWKEAIQRRGRVVALRRIRAGMAMDVWKGLEHRAKYAIPFRKGATRQDQVQTAESTTAPAPPSEAHSTHEGDKGSTAMEEDKKEEDSPTPMEGVESTNAPPTKENKTSTSTTPITHATTTTPEPTVRQDLTDLWTELETQLREAELSCNEIQTPSELLTLKTALGSDAHAMEQSQSFTPSVGSRCRPSRSPARFGAEEEEARPTDSKKKDKEKQERNSRKEPVEREEIPGNDDVNVVPWPCQSMPMTPHGVALYLSNLSQAPDACSAFTINNKLGNCNPPMAWIEPNIPRQVSPDKEAEKVKLDRLREEVQRLQADLEKEVSANKDFQREIIEGRKRSDEICAMMTLLRTETEAVIERHNHILETPEATNRSSVLYENGGGEGLIHHYEDLDVEEGDYQDDDDEDGTVVADEDEGDAEDQGSFGAVDENKDNQSDSAEDGEIEEEPLYKQQPMKEVVVPSMTGDGEEGEINEDGDGDYTSLNSQSINSKRGYDEASEVTLGDGLDSKRRKVQV